MHNREFIIWLNGYLQLCPDDVLDRKKLFIIKNHMHLVEAVEGTLDQTVSTIWDKVMPRLDALSPDDELRILRKELEAIIGNG